MARIARIPAVFFSVPFILLFFFLAIDSLVGDSPTMDEQNHVARGLAFLKTGDPRLSLEHPPLINAISALPLLTEQSIDLPTDHPSWEERQGWYAFADELFWERDNDPTRMIFLARIPIVFLSLTLALTGFHFARDMWGKVAAFFAFAILLLEPNILAHGRYTTTDIGATTFLLLSTFLLWRMWRYEGWSWWRCMAAGLAVGLALGSKLSMLIFLPMFAILALLPLYGKRWRLRPALRRLAQLVIAVSLGLFVLWFIYGLEWDTHRFVGSWADTLDGITLPMPTYWAGIEQILSLSGGGRPAYLFGEFSITGWWYYFPIAFAVKTPLILLLLIVVSSILLLWERQSRAKAAFLLIPVLLYFIISMQSALNIGYRHLLPILPFLVILISGIAHVKFVHPRIISNRPAFGPILLVIALISVIAIDLLLHPSYLSYFNLAAGGPANGHKILVDSNIDWGQDMMRLRRWMDDNDVQSVKLSWFGTADPDYYGIAYDPLPGLPYHFDLWWDTPFDPDSPAPGVYAISASNLWEIPLEEKTTFGWFRAREPDDRIGYSIHIYRVGDDG
ncbi:MAG TPA: phospholipid carrier-dependent glycosyltransferase [candidate division Zixibacteria bacterium]|nr:phospholipid carrier-dependent glycosyltransferase [candidate division Zixibacteria bacterium]